MDNTTPQAARPVHIALQTRLDTLRVKLHLGGMDAQDEFDKISHDVRQLAHEAMNASKSAAQALLTRVETLEAKLARQT